MFTGFVRHIAEQYLSHVIETPKESEINANFLSKDIRIKEIRLNKNLFTYFSLPFSVGEGKVSGIRVEWDSNNPFAMSMKVTIERVHLVCFPNNIGT
jgi:hypothetical protein